MFQQYYTRSLYLIPLYNFHVKVANCIPSFYSVCLAFRIILYNRTFCFIHVLTSLISQFILNSLRWNFFLLAWIWCSFLYYRWFLDASSEYFTLQEGKFDLHKNIILFVTSPADCIVRSFFAITCKVRYEGVRVIIFFSFTRSNHWLLP